MSMNTGTGLERDERDLQPEETQDYVLPEELEEPEESEGIEEFEDTDESEETAADLEPVQQDPAREPDLAAPYIGPGRVSESEHSVRMNEIQLAFIDDPRRAAQDADALVEDLLRGLSTDLARRRSEHGAEVLRGDAADAAPHTEELRVAVQQSRDLIDLLAQAREQVRY